MSNTETVSTQERGIASIITMDDGKVNALSKSMFEQLNAAVDAVAGDALVITGGGRLFSAGFDLKVLGASHADSVPMMIGGFRFARRLLAHPKPVVMAVNGHAYAMGLFLALSADYRLGAEGDHTLVANEVAIGMTLPLTPIAICRATMTPSAFRLAANLSHQFGPEEAVGAGILHETVPHESLLDRAVEVAERLAALDLNAFAATKQRTNADLLVEVDQAIEADEAAFKKLFP